MNYIVYGQKLTKLEPMLHYKTGDAVYNESTLPIILNQTEDKDSAKFFMNNMLTATKRRQWKIWMEEKP
jgi:hypothetical protein